MKINFIIKHILSFIVLSSVLSCSKQLEEDSRSEIDTDYLYTPQGIEDGLRSNYTFVRALYGSDIADADGAVGAMFTEYGTDLFTFAAGGERSLDAYDNTLSADRNYLFGLWSALYRGVNAANAVIAAASQVQGIAPERRTVIEGEAKFMRGMFYLYLVQTWGPVHHTLEPTTQVITTASRTPIATIYETIVSDLRYAVDNLPPVGAQYGRATQPAAKHLLAKALLARAGSSAVQPTDYTDAAELAISVINDHGFSLPEDFSTVFEQGANEKNSEVIFSAQFSKDVLTNGQGNRMHLFYLMGYDAQPGMARDIENGRPWSRFKPTDFVLNDLFDNPLDTRFLKSFKWVFYANNPGTYTNNYGTSMTLERGDTAVWIVPFEMSDEEAATYPFNIYPPHKYTHVLYPTLLKFLDNQRPDVNEERGSRDFIVMRLAETYLIAAEALMMAGRTEEAVPYINTVRRRAAMRGATPEETAANQLAMEIDASQLNIDFILNERGRELMGENMRWFDLARTGKLVERVRLYNPVGAPNIQDHHAVRPIPQLQIDRTEGGQAAFPQNPGY